MSDPRSLAAAAEEIRAEARAVGALVIPALPGGRRASELVSVEHTDLMALVRHLKPKLVYLDEVRFDAIEHLADLVDGDHDLIDHPAIRSAAKRWERRDGELCQYVAVVVHDGIRHCSDVEVDWMDELRKFAGDLRSRLDDRAAADAERLREQSDAEYRQTRDREARELQALVREKATVLGADTRFWEGKVTKAKRRHLAMSLFPSTINNVVDEAVDSEWLRNRGG